MIRQFAQDYIASKWQSWGDTHFIVQACKGRGVSSALHVKKLQPREVK